MHFAVLYYQHEWCEFVCKLIFYFSDFEFVLYWYTWFEYCYFCKKKKSAYITTRAYAIDWIVQKTKLTSFHFTPLLSIIYKFASTLLPPLNLNTFTLLIFLSIFFIRNIISYQSKKWTRNFNFVLLMLLMEKKWFLNNNQKDARVVLSPCLLSLVSYLISMTCMHFYFYLEWAWIFTYWFCCDYFECREWGTC